MRHDVVIIGEAPGKRDSGKMPLYGTGPGYAGWRLREMAGLTREEWLHVRRVNLFSTLPDKWDREIAKTTALAWCHSLLRECRVILLGKKVASAFNVHCADMTTWTIGHTVMALHDIDVAWIPHPSGRNLLYNDPRVRARVGHFLRSNLVAK